MKKAILGTKVGMTQLFAEDGKVIPVTVIQAGPCTVVQKKTVETDGYEAVVVGYGEVREKSLNKPQKGKFAKASRSGRKGPSKLLGPHPLPSTRSTEKSHCRENPGSSRTDQVAPWMKALHVPLTLRN